MWVWAHKDFTSLYWTLNCVHRNCCRWGTGSQCCPVRNIGVNHPPDLAQKILRVVVCTGSCGAKCRYPEDVFSQKASNSFPQSLWQCPFCKAYFNTLDLFLQPVCFWIHAAEDANGFIPSLFDLRHGWASSAEGLQMWPEWDRQGIPISSCHGPQGCITAPLPSLFCACRSWTATTATPP